MQSVECSGHVDISSVRLIAVGFRMIAPSPKEAKQLWRHSSIRCSEREFERRCISNFGIQLAFNFHPANRMVHTFELVVLSVSLPLHSQVPIVCQVAGWGSCWQMLVSSTSLWVFSCCTRRTDIRECLMTVWCLQDCSNHRVQVRRTHTILFRRQVPVDRC